jgi:hypothetical protein
MARSPKAGVYDIYSQPVIGWLLTEYEDGEVPEDVVDDFKLEGLIVEDREVVCVAETHPGFYCYLEPDEDIGMLIGDLKHWADAMRAVRERNEQEP